LTFRKLVYLQGRSEKVVIEQPAGKKLAHVGDSKRHSINFEAPINITTDKQTGIPYASDL
jgi:hypothetical protein